MVNIFDETGRLEKSLEEIIVKTAETAANVEEIGRGWSVDILVTDLDGIREINSDKRGIDASTDVLSFPMIDYGKDNPLKNHNLFLGDIVICYEKIFSQAEEYGHSNEREAGFLTAHGMLHLMGYDHIEAVDEKEMFGKQDIILNKLGLKR